VGGTAFDEFFRSEYPLLIGFLQKIGFEREQAKDAAAEAMTGAYESWARIDRPRAWVRKVACRIASEQARRAREGPLKAVAGGWASATHYEVDVVELNEEQDLLLRLLRQLPRQQRLVMAWHLDGFDSNEISELLGRPPATVRSTLRHARDRLKAIYPARCAGPRTTSTGKGGGVIK
jgi:RNA polymerase sigma-70 factor (ECF subfamily)